MGVMTARWPGHMASQPRTLGASWAVALAAGGVLLAAGAALIALGGGMPSRIALAERHALSVAAPIAVGIYAWRDGTHARFGRLLILAGVAWFVASFSASNVGVLHSSGRVAGWVVEAGLIYLILAFPSGRLTTRPDRIIAGAAAGLIAVLYLPTAVLVDSFPAPSPLTTCISGCPANAFMALGSEPGWVESAVIPAREALTVLLTLAVVARLTFRLRSATRLMRITLLPVFIFAMLRTLALGLALVLRRGGAEDAAAVAAAAVGLGLPAMCLGFLIGMLRWRIHTADSLLRLAHGLLDRTEGARRRDLDRRHPLRPNGRARLLAARARRRLAHGRRPPHGAASPAGRSPRHRHMRRRRARGRGDPRRRTERSEPVRRGRGHLRLRLGRQPQADGAGGGVVLRAAGLPRAHSAWPPTTSAGASSATCTTAASSGSWPSGSGSSWRRS